MDFWWFQGDLTVFVCPSVRSFPTQDLRIDSLVFFDFLHEVSHKVRNVTKTNFSKKSIETQKVTKMTQKWGFRFFNKNQIICIYLFICISFTLIWKYYCYSNFLQNLSVWEKTVSWIMAQKHLDQRDTESYPKLSPKLWLSFISKIKFAFCMCLGIHKNYKFVVW